MQRQLGRLSDSHVRLFLAIVLRSQAVFDQFYGKLTPAAFFDGGLRRVWQAAEQRYHQGEILPTAPELVADVLANGQDDMSVDPAAYQQIQDAQAFIAWAYADATFAGTSPASPEMERFAFTVGPKVLLQAHVESLVQQLPGAEASTVPLFLEEAHNKASMFATIDSGNDQNFLFRDGWDTSAPLLIRTTGFAFLDRFMAGGEAPGEAYLFMAPQGTCKTVFSVMKWAASGRTAYAKTFEPGYDGRLGISVLVTYEASHEPEILHRSLSYAASIHKDRLQAMGTEGLRALSADAERPLPYEESLFSQQIADGMFIPERARIEAELGWMNQHLVCFDFSGSDKRAPHAGHGGIPEIVQRLQSLLRARGPNHYIDTVVVDYLGIMADRHLATLPAKDRPDDHKYFQRLVEIARNKIAKAFGCPVWLTHQLSGVANSSASPTKRLHHTDAKGSKMVGENADFAFVVGNLTNESLGVIDCAKRRRYKQMPRAVIQVKGEFNTIVARDSLSIDTRGRIVDRQTQEATRGPRIARPNASSALTASSVDAGDGFDSIGDSEE
jgi:hypothetical protein